MDQAYVATILKTYKETALVPQPVSAILRSCTDSFVSIYSIWKIPEVVRAESTLFSREFNLQFQSDTLRLSCSVPNDISSMSLQVFTKSGNKYAVFRKHKKSEDALFLEVWNSNKKESTFDLSEYKEHGKVQDSGSFSSFEWSSNEKYLLYIADAPKKKNESYFKDFFYDHKSEQKSTDDVTKGEEFLYKESWGERNTIAHHTVLCIFDVSSGNIEVLNMADMFPNVSVAYATWGPNDEHIVFAGYFEEPYRLGIIYCENRRSAIFSYNLKTKKVERLTHEDDICVDNPVFSPDFETFIFLQNKFNGPHKRCRKLMKCLWRTKEIKTVIDTVDEPLSDGFCGVFSSKLQKWWSRDNRYFLFGSACRSSEEIYYVDIHTSEVRKIPFNEECSKHILDIKDSYILAYASNLNKAPYLVIGHFSLGNKIDIKWNEVEPSTKFDDICWKSYTIKPSLPNKEYPNLDNEIITIYSNEKKTGNLIIFPHGGPHGAFTIDYCPLSVAFARLGYVVCKVNYRGSTGYGENSILSLLGNIGSQDVSDVVDAVDFVKELKVVDIKNIFGFGGSHGGFLVAHLLGQHPNLLKAACLRNPVIDLTTFGTSDIPDWGCVEAGICETYDALKNLDPSQVQELWHKSPIKYVNNVVAPTLIMLGKVDLRVPLSHGIGFYRHLKAKGTPVKVYCYDDNHSLSKVGVSTDSFVNITSWFKTHWDS